MSSQLFTSRRIRRATWTFCLCLATSHALTAGEIPQQSAANNSETQSAYFHNVFQDNLFSAEQTSCQSCAPQACDSTANSLYPSTSPDYRPSPTDTASPSFPSRTGRLASSSRDIAAASSPGGYIDLAVPVTQFRLRYDAAYNANRPDRAEFFYPKCGCFGTPDAKGPPGNPPGAPFETSVDYQEIRPYLEYASSERFSIFGEFPVRFINPEVNSNEAGFGDIIAGFKYALIAEQDEYFTFQLKTYSPTGDGGKGLGTEHFSLEPGLLYFNALSDRTVLQAELRDWIPTGGSDFAGNVLRYGVGLGYTTHRTCDYSVTPVAEFVGWTVLDGKQSNPAFPGAIEDASGDTIFNVKLGVRVGFGGQNGRVYNSQSNSVYIGYGRALTGDVWYEDILRLEYRMLF